ADRCAKNAAGGTSSFQASRPACHSASSRGASSAGSARARSSTDTPHSSKQRPESAPFTSANGRAKMAGMLRLVCVGLLALAAPALALDDPDTEVARRHFEKGRNFYDASDYRHALDEFQAARRAKPAPGLDYNIARCYDRLEEYDHAVEHYQLFLTARPDAPDAAEISNP